MFYLKKEIGNVPIYGDEIFTTCLDCGKEVQFDEISLAEIIGDGTDFDFAGTSVICEECTKKRNSQKRTGKLVLRRHKKIICIPLWELK
jgi:hypothetical protein